MNNPVKIAIIYHSGYGHTAVQADAVAAGARSYPGTEVIMINAEDADNHWETLNSSDAIIFGCPTYMGTVSGAMKVFMDKSSKIWFQGKWKDKVAAGFTNSGSLSGDKLNTLTTLAVFAMQHGMIWLSLGLMPGDAKAQENPENLNRMGSYMGAMAQSENTGPEVTPPESDKKTAEFLGHRVAEITTQFKRGKKS